MDHSAADANEGHDGGLTRASAAVIGQPFIRSMTNKDRPEDGVLASGTWGCSPARATQIEKSTGDSVRGRRCSDRPGNARSGHRFCRYADDCNVYVQSQAAGERVMASLVRFLEGKVRLRTNREKSAVAPGQERKFLGYRLWGRGGWGSRPRVQSGPQIVFGRAPEGTEESALHDRNFVLQSSLSATLSLRELLLAAIRTPQSFFTLGRGCSTGCTRPPGLPSAVERRRKNPPLPRPLGTDQPDGTEGRLSADNLVARALFRGVVFRLSSVPVVG